jgi:hypothetical protein
MSADGGAIAVFVVVNGLGGEAPAEPNLRLRFTRRCESTGGGCLNGIRNRGSGGFSRYEMKHLRCFCGWMGRIWSSETESLWGFVEGIIV